MTLTEVLNRLRGVQGHGGQYMAKCPVHGDRKASLSVGIGDDGRVLIKCQAGCSTEDVVEAIGLTMKDLFVERQSGDIFPSYDVPRSKERPPVVATYTYPSGIQKQRRADKSFVWRRPNEKGGWTYNRNGAPHQLYVAGKLEGAIFVVEGEKDADTLHKLGWNAVSGEDGAGHGKWRKEYTEQLKDLHVCVFQDNDQVGKDYAAETCNALHGVCASVRLLDLSKVWPEIPEHGDVTDMVNALGPEQAVGLIGQLVADAVEWVPTNAESKEQAKPRVAKSAAEFGEDDTTFLWHPYLPIGDYTVMMADGGTGKTLLCCGIIGNVSSGRQLPGETFDGNGRNALIISGEDSGEILKKRLKSSGADLEKVFILDRIDSEGMSISEKYEEFEASVLAYKPVLVVLDPWHAFLGEKVDISRVNALRPILQKLSNLCKRGKCAMILISHVNKRAQGENANNAATGSTDLINAARSAFRVIFDEGDKNSRIMVHTKSNYAPYGKSIRYRIEDGGVAWNGYSEVTRTTLEQAARKRSTPGEIMNDGERKETTNSALIVALKKAANPFVLTRYTYEEFKAEYGELIFGGRQPKKSLDAVRDKLAEEGYFLRTGIDVRHGNKRGLGFSIQQLEDVEPEQSIISGV